ncbi:Uncharacterised protein [Mycobacteroides abscessus subsp. abscessus]|nr:Uncharacterised protein [Mycobacteroides abscessus subsp. abscessus]
MWARSPASLSTACGSTRAAMRPNKRLVSTKSATTTQRGGFLVSTEPGASTNLVLRAPE